MFLQIQQPAESIMLNYFAGYGVLGIMVVVLFLYVRKILANYDLHMERLYKENTELKEEKTTLEENFRVQLVALQSTNTIEYNKLNADYLNHIKTSESTLLSTTEKQQQAFSMLVKSYEELTKTNVITTNIISEAFNNNTKIIGTIIPIVQEVLKNQKLNTKHLRCKKYEINRQEA